MLRAEPVPGRDGELLRNIFGEGSDIPVARHVHYRIADEMVRRFNLHESLADCLVALDLAVASRNPSKVHAARLLVKHVIDALSDTARKAMKNA